MIASDVFIQKLIFLQANYRKPKIGYDGTKQYPANA